MGTRKPSYSTLAAPRPKPNRHRPPDRISSSAIPSATRIGSCHGNTDPGRIAKGLAVVAVQLDAINKHPALTMTPEQHRQAIAQAGSGLMREAAQQLDRATQDAERERQQLAGLIGTARRQNALNAWNLVRTNQKEIAACSEAAAKTKKDEHCTITVPAGPAQ